MRLLGAPVLPGAGSQPTEGSPHPQSRRSRILLPPGPHEAADSGFFRSVSASFSLGTQSELLNRVHETGNRRLDPQRIGAAPRRSGEREGGGWRFGQRRVGTGNPAEIDRFPARNAALHGPQPPISDSIRPLPAGLPGPLLHNGPANRSWRHPELTEPASGCCQPTSRPCPPRRLRIPAPAS